MNSAHLLEKAEEYLSHLCVNIPDRPTGSRGNRMATDYVAGEFSRLGCAVEKQWFDCIDWIQEEASLTAGEDRFEALISPFSLGCAVTAPMVIVSTIQELTAVDITGLIVLLMGDIASEQLFPKNFPFINFVEHQRIIALLEDKKPAAIIAATSRNPEVAGGLYPFPLFEDGDFDIPSVYITDEEGKRLAKMENELISLSCKAERLPSTGCNVIARKATRPNSSRASQRITVWAHIDAKEGTPGALDNASGVVTLLLLAELLSDYNGELHLELTAVNGEDYYSAAGQQKYLAVNGATLNQITLGINIDGAGYSQGKTAYSLYGCSDEITSLVEDTFPASQGFVAGDPWYQSDHAIFVMNERPAMAITTSDFGDVWTRIAHTIEDRPELVDTAKLVTIARSLEKLIQAIASISIN
jgi:aminopeptidase YwaD